MLPRSLSSELLANERLATERRPGTSIRVCVGSAFFSAAAAVAATVAAFTFAPSHLSAVPVAPVSTPTEAELVGEYAGGEEITVIMTADPGGMVGLGESQIIRDALGRDAWEEDRSLYCADVLHGRLFGHRILLVTTGIGHDHASVCMSDILRVFNRSPLTVVKEIFFLGTAGFSPRRGGILNPDDCSEAQGGGQTDENLVAMGDVCVSPFSTNWDCQKCEWTDANVDPADCREHPEWLPSACQRAACSKHGKEDLFGNVVCDFWSPNTALADEVLAAASSNPWPQRSSELEGQERSYWRQMSAGAGRAYGDGPGATRPNKAFGYDTCSEATSNTFWEGAPYDELGRQYVADLNNRARAWRGESGGSNQSNQTARDTVCVSSMEATGWMSVLVLRHLYMDRAAIPSVNIRGAADYTHKPVMRDASGRWVHDANYVPDDTAARAADLAVGYHHAINTTSTLMLHVLRLRHEAAARA